MRCTLAQVSHVTGGGSPAAPPPLVYYAFRAGDGELGLFGHAMLGALGILAVLVPNLTAKVIDRALLFYFGPGFWTRRFALDDIVSAEVVRNSPLYGWGIRYTHHG